MTDIAMVYQMLNWKAPSAIQAQGKELARKVKDLSLLIQPPAEPSVWEQCAAILSEKTDTQLEPYLTELLQWLQDLNWPGAVTIAERLKTFSGEKLKKPFEDAVIQSKKMDRHEGSMWQDYLSELLDNRELVPLLSDDVTVLLKQHYHNWGNW